METNGSTGSFARETKRQLCQLSLKNTKKACCQRSLLYGILLFSRYSEDDEQLNRLIDYLMKRNDRAPDGEKLSFDGSASIDRSVFGCPECENVFLRGAFLSGGAIINPGSGYRLELAVWSAALADDFEAFLKEAGLSPLRTSKKSSVLLYFKESENIEDFLNLIGAHNAAFDIMNEKIYREFRNNANRIANCETANIDKTVSAALSQIDAIAKLDKLGRLEQLPDELQVTARLRLENPDVSLAELAEMHQPPITKSGVNHRLAKIRAFAENF